jgi:hypothetical protein
MSNDVSDALKKSMAELHAKRESLRLEKERQKKEQGSTRNSDIAGIGQYINRLGSEMPLKTPVNNPAAQIPTQPNAEERERQFKAIWPNLCREMGMFHFDLFTTELLTPKQAALFNFVLGQVKRWGNEEKQWQHGAFLGLCSEMIGIGKTSLCQAVAIDFWDVGPKESGEMPKIVNGKVENLNGVKSSRLYTGQEFVDMVSEFGITETTNSIFSGRVRVIILDDVCRGEKARFEKREEGQQQESIQSYYFHLINKVYALHRTPRRVALMMTSNSTIPELREFLGDAAWSRLCAMAPTWLKEPFIQVDGLQDYRQIERKAKQTK